MTICAKEKSLSLVSLTIGAENSPDSDHHECEAPPVSLLPPIEALSKAPLPAPNNPNITKDDTMKNRAKSIPHAKESTPETPSLVENISLEPAQKAAKDSPNPPSTDHGNTRFKTRLHPQNKLARHPHP